MKSSYYRTKFLGHDAVPCVSNQIIVLRQTVVMYNLRVMGYYHASLQQAYTTGDDTTVFKENVKVQIW